MKKINISKTQSEKSIKELLEFFIINIDKPVGFTSFEVVDNIRKLLGLRKTGHFGTLDNGVTGVLPMALNRACKLVGYFMHHDKVYIGKMQLHKEISENELKKRWKNLLEK